MIAAISVVGSMWNEPGHSIKDATLHAVDVKSNPINLLYLWGVFVFIKLIHELGHAFSLPAVRRRVPRAGDHVPGLHPHAVR